MNPFDEIIGAMHVHASRYLSCQLQAPWGIVCESGKYARLVVITEGGGWLSWPGQERSVEVGVGSCLIVQPQVSFTLSDVPGSTAVSCTSLFTEEGIVSVRYGGNGARTVLMSGCFSFDSVAAGPLFSLLAPLVHLQPGNAYATPIRATLGLMEQEARSGAHGSGVVLNRLSEALFIQSLRTLCGTTGLASTCWLAGLADKRLARTIQAVHVDICRRWTVEDMAREAGMSRSGFAALFKSIVGETPLEYVTGWRLYRARVLLQSTGDSLSNIASLVGYDSDIALSRAFRRKLGVAPGKWRQQIRFESSPDSHPLLPEPSRT